ncbi:MAG: alginate export family protein [Candidatus Omnitrophota bacterium]
MRSKTFFGLFLLCLCRVFTAYAAEDKENNSDGGWEYRVGADERFRYEYKHDFDLNESIKDNGGLLFNRIRINAKATLRGEHSNELAEIFVEGLDAQAGGYKIKAMQSQKDKFDLHQAYAAIFSVAGSHIDVKIGRQELQYGAGRLITAPAWVNCIRTFDAAVLRYSDKGFYGDLLYAQNVKFNRYSLDSSYARENLSGIYFGYRKNNTVPLWEGYFLSLDNSKGNNDMRRYTAGARFKAAVGSGVVIDIEVPFQFGDDADTNVRAYAMHADISKSFESVTWKPKVGFSYDQASGDKKANDNRNNTFIPFYQSTHDPYGLMDFFRWENMRNPELSVTFSPTGKFSFRPQVDFFWLDSKNDAWYNSSGTVLRTRPARGKCSSYVGSEASVRFYYDFGKNIKFESGYAHFFPGDYVCNTGSAGGADWMYSQLAIKY